MNIQFPKELSTIDVDDDDDCDDNYQRHKLVYKKARLAAPVTTQAHDEALN